MFNAHDEVPCMIQNIQINIKWKTLCDMQPIAGLQSTQKD